MIVVVNREFLLRKPLNEVIEKYAFIEDFLKNNSIEFKKNMSIEEIIFSYDEDILEEKGLNRESFVENLVEFSEQMIDILGLDSSVVEEITILPGINKFGEKEKFDKIVIKKGEIVSIVGPTGSGKSRFLADIEWGAQNDTPTKRTILVNGEPLDKKSRFSSSNSLVAQLSQNMNFIMDLSVYEFLEMHAKSRMVENIELIVEKIFKKANELAGEKFEMSTPVTSLSGGQSRALMIADTAILSTSPIVLIDEIENAGIDREKALELLVGEEKIVLMATHDPLLALMGNKRIIIKNGGIYKIMEVSENEKAILRDLSKLDSIVQKLRDQLRAGDELKFKINELL